MRKNFLERIAEETGLTNEEDILAYSYFCEGADLGDGVILDGKVLLEFYSEIHKKSPRIVQLAEKSFFEKQGNHQTKEKESPLMKKAKERYDLFLNRFIKECLIIKPQEVRMCQGKYPILTGYNYLNDSKIYNIRNTEHSQERNLRVL